MVLKDFDLSFVRAEIPGPTRKVAPPKYETNEVVKPNANKQPQHVKETHPPKKVTYQAPVDDDDQYGSAEDFDDSDAGNLGDADDDYPTNSLKPTPRSGLDFTKTNFVPIIGIATRKPVVLTGVVRNDDNDASIISSGQRTQQFHMLLIFLLLLSICTRFL